jgi:hypothetical protein
MAHTYNGKWVANEYKLGDFLYWFKQAFTEEKITLLSDAQCSNKEAFKIFNTDKAMYIKLAQESAKESSHPDIVYDHLPPHQPIKFYDLNAQKLKDLKTDLIHNTVKLTDSEEDMSGLQSVFKSMTKIILGE